MVILGMEVFFVVAPSEYSFLRKQINLPFLSSLTLPHNFSWDGCTRLPYKHQKKREAKGGEVLFFVGNF